MNTDQQQTGTLLAEPPKNHAAREDGPSTLDGLRRELSTLRRAHAIQHTKFQEIQDEILAAARLQDELGCTAPDVKGVRIHTLHRPVGGVSGDTHETVRLDDSHVSLTVADATGHGVCAGILSQFVQQTMRREERVTQGDDPRDPEEIMQAANLALLSKSLRESYFATAIYAVFDENAQTLRYARSGAPYPILLRPGKAIEVLKTEGPLLGVLDEPFFEIGSVDLQPGDVVLFHTDGLDELLSYSEQLAEGSNVEQTAWFGRLGQRPIKEDLADLRSYLADAKTLNSLEDDVTVVAFEVVDRPSLEFALS